MTVCSRNHERILQNGDVRNSSTIPAEVYVLENKAEKDQPDNPEDEEEAGGLNSAVQNYGCGATSSKAVVEKDATQDGTTSATNETKVECSGELKIMYGGRNILDLYSNIATPWAFTPARPPSSLNSYFESLKHTNHDGTISDTWKL